MRTFSNARDMLARWMTRTPGPRERHPNAGWFGPRTVGQGQGRAGIGPAGHHHDRLLRPRQRGRPFRAVPLNTCPPFDLPQGGRVDPPRAGGKPARSSPRKRAAECPEMLGQAPAMQDVFRAIGRLSQNHVTVPHHRRRWLGQRAGGARAASTRRVPRPFVAINTAAIPRDLLEASSSVTSAVPSPARRPASRSLRAGRRRHALPRRIGDMPFELQTLACACSPTANYYRVGGHSPAAMCASLRPLTRTSRPRPPRTRSARSVSPPQRHPPALAPARRH